MRTLLSAAVAAAALSACAGPGMNAQVIELSAAFDEREAQAALIEGVNTIKGNAFMRQRGGGVVTCAGQEVYLIPATNYARERMRHLYGTEFGEAHNYGKRVTFVPDVLAYKTMVKTVRCDSTGNFAFDRVADGDFFVNTQVIWQAGYSTQGGNLMHRVSVRGGQLVSVVMAG